MILLTKNNSNTSEDKITKSSEETTEQKVEYEIEVVSMNCNKVRGPYKTLERARAAALRWKDKVDEWLFPYFKVHITKYTIGVGHEEVEVINLSERMQ